MGEGGKCRNLRIVWQLPTHLLSPATLTNVRVQVVRISFPALLSRSMERVGKVEGSG